VLFAFVALSFLVSFAPSVVAQEATPVADCPVTTPEENAEIVTRYWAEAVWGAQGVIDELVAEDEVHHWGIGDDTHGLAEFNERWALFNKAFPNLEFSVDLVVVDGNLAATRWTATGTQRGEWQGIAPTDREVTWSGINVFRIDCGKIVESWGEADHIGLRAQLGATDIPAIPAAPVMAATPVAAAATTPCADDSPEANIAVARRWTDEVWTDKNLDVLDEIASPAIVHHGAAFPDVHGVDALKEAVSRQIAAFPDINLTVDEAIADRDLVVVRWSGTGTNEGEFLGLAPTGREVMLTGINVYRIACGQIVESWSELNGLDLLRQIQEAAGTPTP
jgi:predicted ester cyclase